MSSYPNTIELNKGNIEKYGIYTVENNYFLYPKRSYSYFKCKRCNKEFLRYVGDLLYCSNKCSNIIINDNNKVNFSTIKKSFEDEGYILLTNEYKNRFQLLNFICPNGHKHHITWGNWTHSIHPQRCGLCAKNVDITREDIIKLFNEKGYNVILPDKERIKSNEKLEYICPNGHKHHITYSVLKAGRSSCPYCSNRAKIQFVDIKKSFEDERYKVITKENEYVSQNISKIKFICPNGHKHNISARKWRNGGRCGKCRVSKEENKLRNILNDMGKNNYEMNNRSTILNPNTNRFLELDILFKEQNKAIELNGIYWHGKQDKIDQDKLKQELCQLKGIELLILTDKEINNDVFNVKNKIQNFL